MILDLFKKYSTYLSYIIIAVSVFFATSLSYKNKIEKIKNEELQTKNELLSANDKINKQYIDLQQKVKDKEKEDYEKFNALQDNNQKLLNDVSTAKRQLRVKISSCSSASAQAGTSGVGNGETSTGVIDSGYAQSIIEITNKADKYKSQLEALQNYIDTYNDNVK